MQNIFVYSMRCSYTINKWSLLFLYYEICELNTQKYFNHLMGVKYIHLLKNIMFKLYNFFFINKNNVKPRHSYFWMFDFNYNS